MHWSGFFESITPPTFLSDPGSVLGASVTCRLSTKLCIRNHVRQRRRRWGQDRLVRRPDHQADRKPLRRCSTWMLRSNHCRCWPSVRWRRSHQGRGRGVAACHERSWNGGLSNASSGWHGCAARPRGGRWWEKYMVNLLSDWSHEFATASAACDRRPALGFESQTSDYIWSRSIIIALLTHLFCTKFGLAFSIVHLPTYKRLCDCKLQLSHCSAGLPLHIKVDTHWIFLYDDDHSAACWDHHIITQARTSCLMFLTTVVTHKKS